MIGKLVRSDDEWKRLLTPEQYRITRGKGTERPFTGKYLKYRAKGIYHCVACGNKLFDSGTKYDSQTGWPSFWAPISPGNVEEITDTSHGMTRREITCGRCGAHLGHVFEDGPPPTGLRYCMNSVALKFEEVPK